MKTSPIQSPSTKHPLPNPPHETLDQALAAAWSHITDGVTNRRHAFHLPTLCTMPLPEPNQPLSPPEARVVVLRHADAETWQVGCHTDARSPKAAHIRANPAVSWLFYDKQAKTQVRALATATLHTDDEIADEAWAASRLDSRRCYLAPNAPSTTADAPDPNLPDDLEGNPDRPRSELGRPNFAVVRATIHALEWLYLAAKGHRRARFHKPDATPGSPIQSEWLRP